MGFLLSHARHGTHIGTSRVDLLICQFMSQAYLGDTLPPPLSAISKLKIPHPGRMVGQLVMKLTMPGVLGWVLGGNIGNIEKSRQAHCRIADQPHGFSERSFPQFMADDAAIVRAARADWLLLTERRAGSGASDSNARVDLAADCTSTSEAKGIYIMDDGSFIGGTGSGSHLVVEDTTVGPRHARVWRTLASSLGSFDGSVPAYNYHVQDLGSNAGTWLNGRQMARGSSASLRPGDMLEFGRSPSQEVFKVKLQHVSLRNTELCGSAFTTLTVGTFRRESQQTSDLAMVRVYV